MSVLQNPRLVFFNVLGLFAAFAVTPPVRAIDLSPEQQIETLNEALRAFDQATQLRRSDPPEAQRTFEEAARKFQLLVDCGIQNGKLYYNLGNAYLRSGRIGKAILNYRRAEKLNPGDGQLEANLNFARSLRQNRISPSGERAFLQTFFAWHYSMPIRTRWWLMLASYALFWTLLTVRVYWRTPRWSLGIAPLLAVWVCLAGSVAYEFGVERQGHEGVIVTDDVTVRKGNGIGFEPQFEQPLHQGVEFSLLEQRLNWMHIELPDGSTGWIPSNKAQLIRET